MNNDMAACANKTCKIRGGCERFCDCGPVSEFQWMAAFAPKLTPTGWLCDGYVPKHRFSQTANTGGSNG